MIKVETCEQYDGALALLNLFEKLGFKESKPVMREFADYYAYDYARKDCCNSPSADCYCDDFPDYDSYDDNASFEKDEDTKLP